MDLCKTQNIQNLFEMGDGLVIQVSRHYHDHPFWLTLFLLLHTHALRLPTHPTTNLTLVTPTSRLSAFSLWDIAKSWEHGGLLGGVTGLGGWIVYWPNFPQLPRSCASPPQMWRRTVSVALRGSWGGLGQQTNMSWPSQKQFHVFAILGSALLTPSFQPPPSPIFLHPISRHPWGHLEIKCRKMEAGRGLGCHHSGGWGGAGFFRRLGIWGFLAEKTLVPHNGWSPQSTNPCQQNY